MIRIKIRRLLSICKKKRLLKSKIHKARHQSNSNQATLIKEMPNLVGKKINIVCYENLNDWVLGKFAINLYENILSYGIECTIAKRVDTTADVNHHICYVDYIGSNSLTETIMITHVDEPYKGEIDLLKSQLKLADMGICMSSFTLNRLLDKALPKSKLCYINPAHDLDLPHRKIRIGLFQRLYSDGRKKEQILLKLADTISSNDFIFIIIGSGWKHIVNELKAKGFEVNYD